MAAKRASNWAKHNAREIGELKSELGSRGWVRSSVVDRSGAHIGSRAEAMGGAYALSGAVQIRLDWKGLDHMRAVLERAAKVAPGAVARALNRTAEKARTDVTRALVAQAGLKFGRVRKALTLWRANAGSLKAEIRAKDSYTSLTEFGARRTAKGISAAPWGRRQVFDGTFFVKRYGGHVYKRVGAKRFPIQRLYGPAIPVEMVKGQSEAAFYHAVETELPKRLDHELGRLFG